MPLTTCLTSIRKLAFAAATLLVLAASVPSTSWGGPPFLTDDPEPVEHRHWEVYLATLYANSRDATSGTAPHLEVNYGILTDLQLHLIVPLAYNHPKGGATSYGPGDTEFGVKYRFFHETENLPQAGIFPLVEIPTGDSDRGLGSGHVPMFLPLWLQKSWGEWTTYGGGGYWINPGGGNRNFWQLGWLGQREITKALTLGAEIFHFSRDSDAGRDRTGYNVGGIFNLSEEHHILFSAGSDIAGNNRLSAYAGYQLTFGPPSTP